MYKELFKLITRISHQRKVTTSKADLEAYLERKRQLWDESLRYIQEQLLPKPNEQKVFL